MIARQTPDASISGRKAREVMNLTEGNAPLISPPEQGRRTVYDAKVEGLVLVVTATGHRSWYLFRRIPGGTFEKIHLGAYPALRVADARKAAQAGGGAIALGQNPAQEKRRARAAADANSRTFGEWFEDYLSAPKPKKRGGGPKSPKTIDGYRGDFEHHLEDEFAEAKMSEITKAKVEAVFDKISVNAPYAGNRVLAVVRAVYNLAIKRGGFVGVNPTLGIEPNPEESRKRIIDPEGELPDFMRTLEAEKCDIQRDAALFAFYTGQRSASDVCHAEWEFIDLERKRWVIPELSKRGVRHVVGLSDEVVTVLRSRWERRAAWLAEIEVEKAECAARGRKRDLNKLPKLDIEAAAVKRWLFPSPLRAARFRGLPLSSLRTVIDRVEKSAGLDDLRPHDLRRTYGSYAHGAGKPKEHVGAALGHAKGSAATDVYVQAWDAATARVSDDVGEFIRKAREGVK